MSRLDVLLIKPPLVRFGFNISGIYPLPHLGLGYLGAVLAKSGLRVGYIDAQFADQDPSRNGGLLPEAGVYALTQKITNLAVTHRLAEAVRALRPDSSIIVGGPGNVFKPELLFEEFPAYDVLAMGEGENMVAPLVEALLAGKKGAALAHVPGIAVRADGGVLVTKPVDPADLSAELYPMRSLWRDSGRNVTRMHPPYGVHPPVVLLETSRGCSYRCEFCLISHVYRERPTEFVRREIEEIMREDGAREIHFVDPTFTINEKRTEAICDLFDALPRPVKWSCKTRCDTVTPALLRRMARAGCYLIAYGIESAADSVLGGMNKQLRAEQTRAALEWTREAGMRSLGYVLVGSPGETGESVARTNRFLRGAKTWFVLFGINMPGPRNLPPDKNGESREAALLRFYAYGDAAPLGDGGFYGFPPARVNRWMLASMLGVYLYPPSLMRVLRGISSFGELRHYAAGALAMGFEFARFALRNLSRRGAEAVRFGEAKSAARRPLIRDTRQGFIPALRRAEVRFFRSPFGWVFGYVQKYLARKLYREEARNLVDESWNGKSILDVGCGHGTFLLEISRIARDMAMTGVDQSPSLIEFARRSMRIEGRDGVRFEVMDAHDLRFPDETFDIVTSTSSIYLWHDPVRALNGIHRILKPGGRALISDQQRAAGPRDIYRSWVEQGIYGFGLPAYANEELVSFFEKSDFKTFRTWRNGVVIWFEAVKAEDADRL